MLGDGHGGVGRLPAQQRRRVRGGDHDHRARQPLGAQIVLEEFPHLAAALADQGEHRDVAGGVARQHGEQRGFADAGAGEQAEPLAPPAGGEAVERAHAEIEPRPEPRALRGIRRRGAYRRAVRPGGSGAVAVQRPAQRVEHPAQPGVGHRQRAAARPACRCRTSPALPGPSPSSAANGIAWARPCAEADDLGRNCGAVARASSSRSPTDDMAGQAVDIDHQAGQPDHAPLEPRAARSRAAAPGRLRLRSARTSASH